MRLIDADKLKEYFFRPYSNEESYSNIDIRNIIDEQPSAQPEQRWIPCSDRYPNMDERVLVYTVAHEYHVWDCMSNRADNYFWEDEAGLYHDKYEVDLWLPLPELYKAERRTDGEEV